MLERLKEWLGWDGGDEEEYNNEELSPDQILIKFRTKAGAKSTELEHDFYHVPTRDEIDLEENLEVKVNHDEMQLECFIADTKTYYMRQMTKVKHYILHRC